jgi:tetratricopeptide (TPR) repeat protein
VAVALWVSAATDAHAQRDTIAPKTGPSVTGKITAVTATHVEVDVRGAVKRFAVPEIERLTYGDEPADLRTGRTRFLEGQYEDAAALLGRIPPESITEPLIRQELEFYRAAALARAALRGAADKTQAARNLVDFVSKNSTSFHYFEAVQLIGDLAYVMGRYDVAADYYKQLAQAPWPEYQLKANVLAARALQAQEKFAEAQQLYDQVVNAQVDSASAAREKLFAQLGRAVCLAHQGRSEEARQLVEAIIRDNDPQDVELFARAYNALGVCYLKANQPKDALLAFLHTDLLFASESDAHAEALYYLSQLWTQVGRSDRGVAAQTLLKSRYAGSVWANKQ